MTRELLSARLREAPSFYGELVWILMMLEHWLRAHEHRSSSAPLAPLDAAAIAS
jgi:asparagine synthase (glutamine-hydrolysing)